MRALLIALLVAAVSFASADRAAAQEPATPAACPRPVVTTGALTDRAYASWSGLPTADGFTLELLVIWRGQVNWHRSGGGGGGGTRRPCRGPGDLGGTEQAVRIGTKELSYTIDRTTRVAQTMGRSFSLDSVNVIVVDDADSANGGPRIVATLRIDRDFTGAPARARTVLAAHPALAQWTRD